MKFTSRRCRATTATGPTTEAAQVVRPFARNFQESSTAPSRRATSRAGRCRCRSCPGRGRPLRLRSFDLHQGLAARPGAADRCRRDRDEPPIRRTISPRSGRPSHPRTWCPRHRRLARRRMLQARIFSMRTPIATAQHPLRALPVNAQKCDFTGTAPYALLRLTAGNADACYYEPNSFPVGRSRILRRRAAAHRDRPMAADHRAGNDDYVQPRACSFLFDAGEGPALCQHRRRHGRVPRRS